MRHEFNYLGAIEKGRNMPSLDTLLEIADVYGVAASEIVGEVEDLRRASSKAPSVLPEAPSEVEGPG